MRAGNHRFALFCRVAVLIKLWHMVLAVPAAANSVARQTADTFCHAVVLKGQLICGS
jgi:hypothetical protein